MYLVQLITTIVFELFYLNARNSSKQHEVLVKRFWGNAWISFFILLLKFLMFQPPPPPGYNNNDNVF